MEPRGRYNIGFSYVDEYNNSTKVEFEHPTEDGIYEDNLTCLLNDFKNFLRSAGYSNTLIRRIQYLEEEDIEKMDIDEEGTNWWD